MTNQQAIDKLSKLRNLRGASEAVEMALKALREKDDECDGTGDQCCCPKCCPYCAAEADNAKS